MHHLLEYEVGQYVAVRVSQERFSGVVVTSPLGIGAVGKRDPQTEGSYLRLLTPCRLDVLLELLGGFGFCEGLPHKHAVRRRTLFQEE